MVNSIDTEKDLPFISIIIPSRNEEQFIGRCLDSMIQQTYPMDRLEILVLDGMSSDKTREVVRGYIERYSFIRLLDNPKRITPSAFNIGIKNARGEVVMIMSSHATCENEYISKCDRYLREYDADAVGGICVTLPGSNTLEAHSIALVLSHPFGVGNAYFRIGSKEARSVDTVAFGCYKKEVFDKIGLFDEDLTRNQDDEFNLRLIRNGGKILLFPDIISYYYSRDRISKLWRMYFQYGYFKPLVARKVGGLFTWRQTIPSLFISLLFLTGVLSFFSKDFFFAFLGDSWYVCVCVAFFFTLLSIKKGHKTYPILDRFFCDDSFELRRGLPERDLGPYPLEKTFKG